uniref:Kinesin motor domain-containing protein n=1 Tax=Glossina palpalis gambiensis TaxID=67801 RepID=A0A1B0BLR2_9MUSC
MNSSRSHCIFLLDVLKYYTGIIKRKKLTYASTLINASSSRSHCIFLLDVLKYYTGIIKRTSYKFCDLAGSERLDKTGNVGSRLKEAQRINTSLMVLAVVPRFLTLTAMALQFLNLTAMALQFLNLTAVALRFLTLTSVAIRFLNFTAMVIRFLNLTTCIGQKIIAEESFTVLTYGISGSGKTFTLLGDDHRPGIIPRSLENLFSLYEGQIYPNPSAKLINGQITILEDSATGKENLMRKKILAQNLELESQHKSIQQCIWNEHRFPKGPIDDAHVLIWVTFVEIYNEQVRDLLDSDAPKYGVQPNASKKNLKIICNDGRVFIKSATSIYVKSSLEALKLLRYGQKKLTYASTLINANSSRSHCIFLLDILKYYTSVIKRISYKFCDLAGSERLDKTGNVGSRLKEAQRINTSLMVLGISIDISCEYRYIRGGHSISHFNSGDPSIS